MEEGGVGPARGEQFMIEGGDGGEVQKDVQGRWMVVVVMGGGRMEGGGSVLKEGRMRRCIMGVLTFKGTFQVLATNLEVTGEIESDKWIKRDLPLKMNFVIRPL